MKKILSIIFTIIIILILFYITFIVKPFQNYEKPNFSNKILENMSFDINDKNEIFFDKKYESKTMYLTSSDKILSSFWEFNYDEKTWEINIEKWFFLININSLDKKYKIKWKWIFIEIDSPNTFLIDTTEERFKILSIVNILKLELTGKNNWEENFVFNSIYLYPNQFIIFNPDRNFLIKNADLFRITQILSLNYFNENILQNGELNPTFKKIFLSKNPEITKQQENLFKYIYIDYSKIENKINSFKSKKIIKIPWKNYILKYAFLFLNKEKKIIYIENQILEELQNILKKEKTNNDFKELENLYQELKNLDKKSFEEMKNLLKNFIWDLNLIKKDNTNLLIWLSKVVNKDFEIITKNENFWLNYTFFKYNFINPNNFFSEIKTFIDTKSKTKLEKNEYNYFIFFINNIILANLDQEIINFNDTIDIFKYFSKAAIKYYSAKDEEDLEIKDKIIQTGIVNLDKILTKLINKTEEKFFTINENWILEPKKDNLLNKNYSEILWKSVKDIYESFYNLNENQNKDATIKNNYIKNLEKFKKLYMALTDYENYLVKNDTKISDLTKEENNYDSELSIEKVKKYLSQFNYLTFWDENIEIMWKYYCENPSKKIYEKVKSYPTCYKISNIIVWNGNDVSFLLYPNEFNKISNILINWDSNINKWTYKLDEIEDNFEQNSWNKEKFRDFFVNILIPNNSSSNKTKEEFNTDFSNNDNSIIRALKNSTFLWKDWIFSKIQDILKIEYKNISITETSDKSNYIIKINDVVFNKNTKNRNYKWILNSDYKYKKWSINSFFNPEITLSDLHFEVKIKISWFIKLEDFHKNIENLFSNMDEILNISKTILKIDNQNEIKIIYFPSSNKIEISSKNVKLYIVWDKIEEIVSFWKKILVKNEKMNKIEELLNIK